METERDIAMREMQELWTIIFQQGAFIALLPIEKLLKQLNDAENIAPFIDPTLYRDYIYSKNGEMIKGLLKAALVFKNEVVRVQEIITTRKQNG